MIGFTNLDTTNQSRFDPHNTFANLEIDVASLTSVLMRVDYWFEKGIIR